MEPELTKERADDEVTARVAAKRGGSRSTTLPVASADRKRVPLYEGLLRYFPAALAAVTQASTAGQSKHVEAQIGTLRHVRSRSKDHADCILRHLVDLSEDFGSGVGYGDHGIPQVAYIAWRALALAQEWLEKNEGAPLAPAADVST